MVVFPSEFVLLGQATAWAPCHVFNEHLRVNSTLAARFSAMTSGLPVHQWDGGGRALPQRPVASTGRDRIPRHFAASQLGSNVTLVPM
jgi:hypothetical protein